MKSFLGFLIVFMSLFCSQAFAAGTVTVTRENILFPNMKNIVHKVTIDWVGDASAATVPSTNIAGLNGYVIKVVTNPGSVAPTDNYDIAFGDPEDTALDAFATLINNRDTANSEQVYPLISGAAVPIFLNGTYQFQLSNNAVNSATGRVILYIAESL